jgi:FKBP-type peptidyl-prolyl cis-trans isomerase (trigger factor)
MTNTTKSYDTASVKKLGKSSLEITGSITAEIWGKYRTQALKDMNESITIDGFRKGMIPENILISKVGEMNILEKMAEMAMTKAYFDIIIDNKIDAIGRPSIQLTKLAKDNPLEFKITTSIMPEAKLPDYKKVAEETIKGFPSKIEEVSEKEIEEAIVRIRKSHASHEGYDHSKMTAEEHDKALEENMPELTDTFVKTLGNFSDVPDFKDKLSKMIAEEKIHTAKEKCRIAIAEAISNDSIIELPEIMVESETNRIEAQFKADIERMGVKLEDYLKHAKKTIDEIRKEWKPQAEKKVKLQLILNAIAEKENIKPDQKEVENEVNHILEHYKDADREHATTYAETVLMNEKVFQWLEK